MLKVKPSTIFNVPSGVRPNIFALTFSGRIWSFRAASLVAVPSSCTISLFSSAVVLDTMPDVDVIP